MTWKGWDYDWVEHLRMMQQAADLFAPDTFLLDIAEPMPRRPGRLMVMVGFKTPVVERKYAEKRWGADWMALLHEKERVDRGVQKVIGEIKKHWTATVGSTRMTNAYILGFNLSLNMERDEIVQFLGDLETQIAWAGLRRGQIAASELLEKRRAP